jgi:PAS domain S-box-containing protein
MRSSARCRAAVYGIVSAAMRALQNAILTSTGFLCIVTDEAGVIRVFNAGAKRMLGYTGAEVVGKLTPADLADPLEALERARALSLEFATTINPGVEALVFKASRGIEDRYRLTYVRKDGGRLAAVVSVTALDDSEGGIIGYLLMASADAARAPAPDATAQAGTRRGLLYVEDQPTSLGLVEQLVARRSDVVLLRAANPELGIELARGAHPDVILLNADLPGPGALAFMKRMRADPATQNTPVLALGANASPDAIARALEAGFFHYLIKPLKPERFTEALEYALEFSALERLEENHMPSRTAGGPSKQLSKESP